MLELDLGGLRRRDLRQRTDVGKPGIAHILTVCTGNVCRSPLAEQLLRARLGGYPVEVASVGTRGLSGRPMDPEALRLADELGVPASDSTRHRGRRLQEDHLRLPTLVFALDRSHRRHIAEMSPALVGRTFTMREFARLSEHLALREIRAIADGAGSDPATRVRAVARRVQLARGEAPPPLDPTDDDVVDPYLQEWAEYRRSSAQLVPAVDEVTRVLREALR